MVETRAELTKKATEKAWSLDSSYPSASGKVEMTAQHLQKGHSTVETKVDYSTTDSPMAVIEIERVFEMTAHQVKIVTHDMSTF